MSRYAAQAPPGTRSATLPKYQRRTVHFGGRVQGVGFRYTTRNIALGYDVQGYVRNLPDGRVELVMEGPDSEMDQVVGEVQRRMSGYIRSLESHVSPATREFEQFTIRH
jgi:acylphosphatase